jgi:hypothetical protein
LFTHWKKHCTGVLPPWAHWRKHVKSSMQSGEPKHAWICEQQFCATQSPHTLPSLGHVVKPQKPRTHWPLQHAEPSWQVLPSG